MLVVILSWQNDNAFMHNYYFEFNKQKAANSIWKQQKAELQIRGGIEDNPYISFLISLRKHVTPPENRQEETVPMMVHKISFYGQMWLITPKLSLFLLIWSSEALLHSCIITALISTSKGQLLAYGNSKNADQPGCLCSLI